MQRIIVVFAFVGILVLPGCSGLEIGSDPALQAEATSPRTGPGMMGRGMGPGSGMMDRHHVQVPDEFAGLDNPIPANEDSLLRGEESYVAQCATCHGDYGNGDGPGGANLDPAPAPIAHTSQMMSDAYLFWRITEGGIPFETGMLPYRDILDEQARWDVINYVRALGRGQVQPGEHMGGRPFDPAQEQARRAEMLSGAVEQEIITQAEADLFDRMHNIMDEYLSQGIHSGMGASSRADALPQILEAMVAAALISQDQSNSFLDVHDRLIEAGLMQ